MNLGYDVDIGPLFQTPEEVAQQAIDADVVRITYVYIPAYVCILSRESWCVKLGECPETCT